MLFSSLEFFLFLIPVLVLSWILPNKWRNLWLLIGSYFLYGLWGIHFLSLLIFSTLVDFFVALAIGKARQNNDEKRAFLLLWVSLSLNLGLLILFKYLGIFSSTKFFDIDQYQFRSVDYVIPVGISFYTFQTLSYTIDVYRGNFQPTHNFINFALYVAFFPQILAGPIERAKNLLVQIQGKPVFNIERFIDGTYVFIWGLFLKTVVADNLAPYAIDYFDHPTGTSTIQTLLSFYGAMLQVYADFSGYSLMALGMGKLLGFDLSLNFRQPFFAKSPQEFFSRWHITLMDWFRLYLYRPFHRWAKKKNLPGSSFLAESSVLMTFSLWHGFSWRFFIWGIELIFLFNLFRYFRKKEPFRSWSVPRPLAAIFWFQFLTLSAISYRANSLSDLPTHFSNLFVGGGKLEFMALINVPFFFAIVLLMDLYEFKTDDQLFFKKQNPIFRVCASLLVLALIIAMGAVKTWDFIYFEF